MIIALSQNIPNFSMREHERWRSTVAQSNNLRNKTVDASAVSERRGPGGRDRQRQPTPPCAVWCQRVLEWVVRAGCSGEVTWLVA